MTGSKWLLAYVLLSVACSSAPSSEECSSADDDCTNSEGSSSVNGRASGGGEAGSPTPASGGATLTPTPTGGSLSGTGSSPASGGALSTTGGRNSGGNDSVEDPSEAPEDYSVVYFADYETTQGAGDYLGNDVWYFYDGGGATDNDNPELDKRFFIAPDPQGGDNLALSIIKFDDDDDYSGKGLNPRAELSMRPSQEIGAENELYYRMRTYFPAEQANVFAAEFTQFWLHGDSNIPLQLEVRDGVFKARRPGQSPITIDGEARLSEHTGRWMTWEVYAKFNQTGGYWRIYLDGQLVYEETGDMSDWPSDDGTFHTQYGAYANNGGDGTMQVYFDDYLLAIKE